MGISELAGTKIRRDRGVKRVAPNTVTITGWIIGFVGGLLVLCGTSIAYIFNRHVSDNDTKFRENREDHQRIWDHLDNDEGRK